MSVGDAPVGNTSVATRLVVRGVSHRFADHDVIHDVSLTLSSGEIVAIVGPSGCGKTTLLRACAGLVSPSNGTIERTETKVGFVFQESALLAWRRVEANAALLVDDDTDDDADDHGDAIVEQLLAVSGLSEHRHKWPYQLSGGMKMRLALVRTLAAKPQLVLLDEPFGALDQITRHRLHDEFLRLHAQQRFTALMVTHAIDEAVYLADRVVVMSPAPGHIIAEFEVAQHVPHSPASRESSRRYDPSFAALCGRIAARLGDHS
ncbi:MAG: ABC transporter ATP-binding protein, partial [Actinomycetota bacterium]